MILKEEILKQIHKRSFDYDKSNVFPIKDYEDLKKAGYYKAMLSVEDGGSGLTLAEVCKHQIALSYHSPGTSLGINMHQIVAGVGIHLLRNGNKQGQLIIDAIKNDNLLAFAISEQGNDHVIMDSISNAVPNGNDYIVTGKKVYVSNAKVADYYLTFARDSSDKEKPLNIFSFISTKKRGIEITEDWNTIGMRGTQSNTINFRAINVLENEILSKVAPYDISDPLMLGIFANFELLLAATYHGIGKRALEVGIQQTKKRFSVLNNATYDKNKDIRWRIAEAAIELDGIEDMIYLLADRFEAGVEDALWLAKLSSIKNKSVEASIKAVNEVIRSIGGRGYFTDQEITKLYRDVLAGLFQPSDQESLHNAWAKALLG